MTTRIAFVLLSALSATVALPVVATTALALERHDEHPAWDADTMLRRLQQNGVDATSVEEWNGLVRAYVRSDGGQIMQYFDPDTLAPVTI